MTATAQQIEKMHRDPGFIAALDQSGGSTPKALRLYGVDESQYNSDDEMFVKVHAMRTRIIRDDAFDRNILGAILFEDTMNRAIDGIPSARYLWEKKNILPILKVDKGLADEADGVQMMKPMPALDELLERANQCGIFGTKMRSVIKTANPAGIGAVVAQQFEIAQRILARGLIPIIEPEIDIHSPQKAEAESLLKTELGKHLANLDDAQRVIFKLTLPEQSDFYAEFCAAKNCLRVAALSGGYDRAEACRRLAQNRGMIASFSRALTEGLSIAQTEDAFSQTLSQSILAIAEASAT